MAGLPVAMNCHSFGCPLTFLHNVIIRRRFPTSPAKSRRGAGSSGRGQVGAQAFLAFSRPSRASGQLRRPRLKTTAEAGRRFSGERLGDAAADGGTLRIPRSGAPMRSPRASPLFPRRLRTTRARRAEAPFLPGPSFQTGPQWANALEWLECCFGDEKQAKARKRDRQSSFVRSIG